MTNKFQYLMQEYNFVHYDTNWNMFGLQNKRHLLNKRISKVFKAHLKNSFFDYHDLKYYLRKP